MLFGVQSAGNETGRHPRVISHHIDLAINDEEAVTVLAIWRSEQRGNHPTDEEWCRLFSTKPYKTLKMRECRMGVEFSDEAFKRFAMSPDVVKRVVEFTQTLKMLAGLDLSGLARQVLRYLPADAEISAEIFYVIKPSTNSFVYESTDGPTIFISVDPGMAVEQIEEIISHELHHIGLADVGSRHWRYEELSSEVRNAIDWLGAFCEGLAMMTAADIAGTGPCIGNKRSPRKHWDTDMAHLRRDMKNLERFFIEILEGRLVGDDIQRAGRAFYGARGPWYSVGWEMAAVIELCYGRDVLIETMLDLRMLLVRYNNAVRAWRSIFHSHMPLWSERLLWALFQGDPASRA